MAAVIIFNPDGVEDDGLGPGVPEDGRERKERLRHQSVELSSLLHHSGRAWPF
jgi:hypothetical protein